MDFGVGERGGKESGVVGKKGGREGEERRRRRMGRITGQGSGRRVCGAGGSGLAVEGEGSRQLWAPLIKILKVVVARKRLISAIQIIEGVRRPDCSFLRRPIS